LNRAPQRRIYQPFLLVADRPKRKVPVTLAVRRTFFPSSGARNAPAPVNVRALTPARKKKFDDFTLPCQNLPSVLAWLHLSCGGKKGGLKK
jgi:hypothetical protein